MYIVAIAWLFTAAMLTLGQTSIVAAVLTFFFWGIMPVCLILWLVGTPTRIRRKSARQDPHESNPPVKKDHER